MKYYKMEYIWVRLKFLENDSISIMPNVIPKDVVFSARRKLIKQKWFCLYVISVRGLNKHLKCNVILYHSACIVGYRKHLLSSAGIYLPSILSSVCGIVTSSLFDYFIQHSIFSSSNISLNFWISSNQLSNWYHR